MHGHRNHTTITASGGNQLSDDPAPADDVQSPDIVADEPPMQATPELEAGNDNSPAVPTRSCYGAVPANAEGWFAIPKWQTFTPTYGEAVEKVLAKVNETRTFKNWREGGLGPDHLKVGQDFRCVRDAG